MKRILLIFTMLTALAGQSLGKSSENVIDTIAFMQDMATLGNNNRGGKISIIIDSFRHKNFHIEFLDYYYTSPFIDPEGKGYLECINISCYSPSLEKWPVLTVYINETNCESEHFEDEMHAYDGDGEERADRIKDLFTIKRWNSISGPWITLRKSRLEVINFQSVTLRKHIRYYPKKNSIFLCCFRE